MRWLGLVLLATLLACVAVACGPSSKEVMTAKEASYTGGEASAMFKIVVDTTAETYKIAHASQDGDRFVLVTEPQWYNAEGGRQSVGAGDSVRIGPGSVRLEMLLEMVPTESNRYMIAVTPKTFQHVSGSPQPRELAPDDPNLPGWVSGRVDSLYVAIHKRLQNYAVK